MIAQSSHAQDPAAPLDVDQGGDPVQMRMKITKVEPKADAVMDSGEEIKQPEKEGARAKETEYAVEFLKKDGDQADFLAAFKLIKENWLSFAIERI